ncbi:MAG: hypothetical protein IPK13_17215 [Deltaproteobacteria bacterium]|nr:hypothetical protein [Deltaproteobacteria bacterium]
MRRSAGKTEPHYDGGGTLQHLGNFFDPYVGKYYPEGHTEVVSMGLQQFAHPKETCRLAIEDSEHFYFMLGTIAAATTH